MHGFEGSIADEVDLDRIGHDDRAGKAAGAGGRNGLCRRVIELDGRLSGGELEIQRLKALATALVSLAGVSPIAARLSGPS